MKTILNPMVKAWARTAWEHLSTALAISAATQSAASPAQMETAARLMQRFVDRPKPPATAQVRGSVPAVCGCPAAGCCP
ncbi:hypothetical protein DB347_14075 [Opitutaceae bacterium EW11]|nr:hypothetical protein DB347_14075 [Opitutaceae bacterium EW11]